MTDQTNKIYRDLLDALHAHEIRYAVLRDDVTSSERIRDLDVLIDARQAGAFRTLAAEAGFVMLRDDYFNPGKEVWLLHQEGKGWLLDVHYRMVYRGIEFLRSEELLANRVRRDGYFVLSNEDFFLSLLFHNVFAKKKIQDKHAPALRRLLASGLGEQRILSHLRSMGLEKVYRGLVRDFEATCSDPKQVRRARKQALRRVLMKPGNFITARVALPWRRLKSRFAGPTRGVLVAFLGPDGTGKSTMIKAVREHLRGYALGTTVAYMGPWGGSVLNLRKIFFWLNPSPYRSDYKAWHAGKLKEKPGPLRGMARLKFTFRSGLYYAMLIIEMWTRWWVRVLPPLRQQKVVLGDRYIHDILTGYKNRPMDYQVELRESLCARYPSPHVGVLLDSTPEIIFKRKPQLDREALQRGREAYRKVAEQYGFIILDTSESVARTLEQFDRDVLPKILEHLRRQNNPRDRAGRKTSQDGRQHSGREKVADMQA